MGKVKSYSMFALMALLLGAVAGAIVWFALKIINAGIDIIWYAGSSRLWYNLIICLAGAVLIGLFQRKNGILPHDSEQVFAIMKTEGRYPYDKIGIIIVAAILPLIFGGALGPEAGLTGVIAGLCYWVGDSLKKRGDKFAKMLDDGALSPEAIAETGFSVVISVVFGTPLAGIVGNLERNENGEKPRQRLLRKRGRIILYCAGVIGGMLAAVGLGKLLALIADATANEWFIEFANGGGLPRFDASAGFFGTFNVDKLMWVVPLMLAGIALAFIYKSFDKITKFFADKIANYRVVSCLIAGLCVAVCGWLLPNTMFSGEHQLCTLIGDWQTQDATVLILTSVVKIILVSICINFGWRGGSIFPIIFCGSSAAFAMALIIGPAVLDGAFAAAILVSAMYSYISRKPFMSVLILLLCFPVSYIIPMLIVGYVASKIPTPFKEAE